MFPQINGETMETETDFICGGSKITADGDCSHEIKRHLLLGGKAMTKLDSILKSRDITLPINVHLVKAMVFPVVMYRCEGKWKWSPSVVSDPQRPHGLQPSRLLRPWDFASKSTGVGCRCLLRWMWELDLKKAESRRIDAFELWCWRRLLRIPWTERRSNQSILKEISPEYSLEGLMLKLKLQSFGHLMWRTDSLKRPWCWEKFVCLMLSIQVFSKLTEEWINLNLWEFWQRVLFYKSLHK